MKTNKKIIAFSAMGLLIIVLFIISEVTKKENQTAADKSVCTTTGPDNTSRQPETMNYSDYERLNDPIAASDEPDDTFIQSSAEQITKPSPAKKKAELDKVSFISSNRELLIYHNCIYKKVSELNPQEKKDTIVVNGKKYINVD